MGIGVLTIVFSSIAALYQKKIKRFIAYSSINHVGYLLVGLSTGTTTGQQAFFLYLIVYMITLLVFFGILISLRVGENPYPRYLMDLLQCQNRTPLLQGSILLVFFSMSGIPPLMGFFSKLYVFFAAMDSQYYHVLIPSMLCSALSAFYYIRIIKIMNFEHIRYSIPLQWE